MVEFCVEADWPHSPRRIMPCLLTSRKSASWQLRLLPPWWMWIDNFAENLVCTCYQWCYRLFCHSIQCCSKVFYCIASWIWVCWRGWGWNGAGSDALLLGQQGGLLTKLLGPGGECKGYSLRFVGHSLGGSIAALTALRVQVAVPIPWTWFASNVNNFAKSGTSCRIVCTLWDFRCLDLFCDV